MNVSKQAYEEVLSLHQRHNIPLQHSIALLCKTEGIGMSELAESCGKHRNYLNQSLRGIFKPTHKFRMAITKKLGVDPWKYQSDRKP
jgi:transcriptional regulator with XRE-family HTH domain